MDASEEQAQEVAGDQRDAVPAGAPAGASQNRAFGGLTPYEAGLRRARLHAERQEAARLRAEADALGIKARAATALSTGMTTSLITDTIDALAANIRSGKDAKGNAGELRHWLALAVRLQPEAEAEEGASWADMTPGQQASLRATMLRLAEGAEAAQREQAEVAHDETDPRFDD